MVIKKDGKSLFIDPVEGGRLEALHPEYGQVVVNIIRLDTNNIEEAEKAVVSDPDRPGSFRIVGCAAVAYVGVKNPGDTSEFSVETFEEEAPNTPNSVEPSPSV